MKLTAKDLYELKVIDKIIKEPEVKNSFKEISNNLKKEITETMAELNKLSAENIVENRYEKFRHMGEVIRL